MMNEENDQDSLRVTSVVVLAVLLVGYFFGINWLVYTGLGLMGLALLSSTINEYFAWIWMAFARMIGTVNSKILLTIIFYLFLTPVSVLYRAISGSPILTVEDGKDRDTYFVSRNKTFTEEDFEAPW